MSQARLQRIKAVLDRRQPDLTVIMEDVHKPHNVAAVVRTCDAVGILDVHAVTPTGRIAPHHDTASGSQRWVRVHAHRQPAEAIAVVRALGMQILAAQPGPASVDFREVDYRVPTALLIGSELEGVSTEALAAADRHIAISMHGMVASLNVSVAAAVILFEAQRQRQAAGRYRRRQLEPAEYQRLLFEWMHPRIAAHLRARNLPYPALDADGDPRPPD